MLAVLRKGVLDIPMMFTLLRVIPVYGTVWATPIADVLCCMAALMLLTAFIRSLGTAPQVTPPRRARTARPASCPAPGRLQHTA